MKDAFEQLMREADKPTQVPESIAKYAAALVAGTHEITSLTIRPNRTWVGLTLEDMETTHWSPDFRAGAKWAAAKLKEKNT